MIDADEVVQRLDRREDAKIVAYQEVGLPVFRLNCLLTLQEDGALGAIEEFVLRSISASVDTSSDLERFLGLHPQIVSRQLGQLAYDGSITQIALMPPRYGLTRAGRTRLDEGATTRITKEQVPIYVDGVTRGVIPASPQDLWSNAQLERLGIPVIVPTPRRAPRTEEVDLNGINRVLSLVAGGDEPTKRAVRLDAIIGRIAVMFVRALALAFKSDDGRRICVGFAIDGRTADEHETAFARRADSERSTLFAAMFDSTRRRREAQAVFREFRIDMPSVLPAATKAEGARSLLSLRKEAPIGSQFVRPLRVYEYRPLLKMAVETAKSRILIICPRIRASVVDETFVKSFVECLSRGVEMTIAYSAKATTGSSEQDADRKARAELGQLCETFRNCHIYDKGDVRARVLLVDNRFFAVTTFNWLSFNGELDLPMKEEEGMLIDEPASVDTYFEKLIGRIEDAQHGKGRS